MTDRLIRSVPAIWLIVTLSGCGVELVGGGLRDGEAEAVMTDDAASGGSSQPYRSPGAGPALSRSFQISPIASGSVEADVSVALVADDGATRPVTNGAARGEVGIASGDSIRLGLIELQPARYPRIRVTFERVEAVLSAGLGIGGGASIEGRVTVDTGAGPVVIEVPTELVIRENRRTTIVIDLNASAWLAQADPIGKVVPAAAFREAVAVRVR